MPMRWFYGKGRYGVLPLKARMSTAALTEKKKSDVDVDDVKAGCNLVYSILSSSIAGAVCRQPNLPAKEWRKFCSHHSPAAAVFGAVYYCRQNFRSAKRGTSIRARTFSTPAASKRENE